MQAMLSGKRPSFKVEFTNNLSLRLQRAGKKIFIKLRIDAPVERLQLKKKIKKSSYI